mgnify:CR=1 FL=1
MQEDEITQLKEALAATPNNVPLRRMLANALMRAKQYEEAEIEWKEILRLAPHHTDSQVSLAECFLEQGKTSLGLVILEELTSSAAPPARAWLVFAKLLLKAKQITEAREAYDNAVALDGNLRDSYLESEINLASRQHQGPEPEKVKLGGGSSEDQEERIIDIERPKVNFDDVGGMDAVKQEIKLKIIHPLEHPDLYKAYGKKIGGGILLYGPPGCGKTFLARATAGQVQANFLSVGLNDILDMWLGQSERNLHAVFQKARQIKPSVLFFDEVDALGASRSDMRQSAGRHLINQFLSELDGVEYNNDGLLILGATNAPWHLDPAFRRPGRFDRIIFVPPPDEAGRAAILKLKMEGKPAGSIDFEKIARRTPDYSGADLEAIVDLAIEAKLMESMRKGVPLPLQTDDLLDATKQHRPSTKEWFNTAKNYALFANDSGLYDDILTYLKIKK